MLEKKYDEKNIENKNEKMKIRGKERLIRIFSSCLLFQYTVRAIVKQTLYQPWEGVAIENVELTITCRIQYAANEFSVKYNPEYVVLNVILNT